MYIDTARIQTELQEYAGAIPLKVKRDREQRSQVQIRYTDNKITISFNPSRIRSPATLQSQLDWVKQDLTK